MITGLLATGSGMIVGFMLGLLGGGGAILAVPLLIYAVGVKNPHVAIGTGAVAVCASAVVNLVMQARKDNIKWPCAITFALAGSVGAVAGAELGKAVSGKQLLLGFSAVMFGVGLSMLRRKPDAGDPHVRLSPRLAMRIVPTGLVTGAASGFFGVGGGFLVVPGLIGTTNMIMLHAVGSSLVAVAAFSATTATSYARSGFVLWDISGFFIAGGCVGGFLGQYLGAALLEQKHIFQRIFAGILFLTAIFIALKAVL